MNRSDASFHLDAQLQVVADAAAHIVRCAIKNEGGGTIDVTAAAAVGDHAAHVEAKVEGEGTTIAFNAKYLVDVLSRVDADRFALELTGPVAPGLERVYDTFSDQVLPRVGQWVTGRGDAYQYLVDSIRKFPLRDEVVARMEAAGLARVRTRVLSGGIATLYSAWRL